MQSLFTRTPLTLALCGLAATFAVGANGVFAGQSPAGPPSEKNMFIETPAGWKTPKTAWGDPDLQGTWPINYVGGVPLERCAGGGGRAGGPPAPPCDPNKAFYTEEEFKARIDAVNGRGNRYAEAMKKGDFGAAFNAGNTDPTTPQRQTSLIVDPPNGRLPEMTEEGKRRSALMRSSWAVSPDEVLTFDSELDFDTWDRCITRGMPASMFPFRYNNGVQILQTPGYVVLNMEMIHEARIIPVSSSGPRPSPKIKEWLGVSRGHWEGNTLVIETTNFKPGASATNIGVVGAPPGNRFPTSEKMKITERMTRMNDTMLLYEITTEDPVVITRPWTARFPLKLDNNYKWWEYACLEGNRTIPDYISASRAERAQAAKEGAQ